AAGHLSRGPGPRSGKRGRTGDSPRIGDERGPPGGPPQFGAPAPPARPRSPELARPTRLALLASFGRGSGGSRPIPVDAGRRAGPPAARQREDDQTGRRAAIRGRGRCARRGGGRPLAPAAPGSPSDGWMPPTRPRTPPRQRGWRTERTP